ncbi:MAG: hypothetical protein KGZ40_08435 [Clostridiales bacterium]|nr:hypothetical protein [Clostridiales bacterium]
MTSKITNRLAIAEIAGRDSVAAAVAAVRTRGFTQLLPTIAFTGTEFGDAEQPLRTIDALRVHLGGACEVFEPVYLQEPRLWAAMNARYATVIADRYGMCSPCLACHLYLHLLRVPLAWEAGGVPIIAGERDTHDGRIKLSQTAEGIDAAVRVLAYVGIELLQPIRHASGEQVAKLASGAWKDGGDQLECLLSGNYTRLDGSVMLATDAYQHYLAGYFEPVGRAVLDAWRTEADGGGAPEWDEIVRRVLGDG